MEDAIPQIIIIKGVKYDVSYFMSSHPGGAEILRDYLDKDATAEFESVGHSKNALEILENLRVIEGNTNENNENNENDSYDSESYMDSNSNSNSKSDSKVYKDYKSCDRCGTAKWLMCGSMIASIAMSIIESNPKLLVFTIPPILFYVREYFDE